MKSTAAVELLPTVKEPDVMVEAFVPLVVS